MVGVEKEEEHLFKGKRVCNFFDIDVCALFNYEGQLQTRYSIL